MKTRHYSPEKMGQYTRSKEAPFKCKDCPAVFQNEGGIIMHWRRVHGNVKVRKEAGYVAPSEPAVKRPRKVKEPADQLCFCPKCGCNLAYIRAALEL